MPKTRWGFTPGIVGIGIGHAEKKNDIDRQFWRDLGDKCWKLAEIHDATEREKAIRAYFPPIDMNDPPPSYLTEYLQSKGLPPVGEFEETEKGIIQGPVYFDEEEDYISDVNVFFLRLPDVEA